MARFDSLFLSLVALIGLVAIVAVVVLVLVGRGDGGFVQPLSMASSIDDPVVGAAFTSASRNSCDLSASQYNGMSLTYQIGGAQYAVSTRVTSSAATFTINGVTSLPLALGQSASVGGLTIKVSSIAVLNGNPRVTFCAVRASPPSPSVSGLPGCNIDFRMGTPPSTYLDEHIVPQKDSDWMYYPSLVDQTAELISKTTSPQERAHVIGDWVKGSRPYGFDEDNTSVANRGLSVQDIYDEDEGVCYDSAILTVAMLRLADVPARVAFPAEGQSHARVEAFFDGRWNLIDTTFGIGPADYSQYGPHSSHAYLGVLQGADRYAPTYASFLVNPNVYKLSTVYPVTSTFGEAVMPVVLTNTALYVDGLSDVSLWSTFERTDARQVYYGPVGLNGQITGTTYAVSASLPPPVVLYPGTADEQTVPYRVAPIPDVVLRVDVEEVSQNAHGSILVRDRYLATTRLPIGTYRISYIINVPNVGQSVLAYADFEVRNGQTAAVRSNALVKSPGASQAYFDALKARVDDTWSRCASQPLV